MVKWGCWTGGDEVVDELTTKKWCPAAAKVLLFVKCVFFLRNAAHREQMLIKKAKRSLEVLSAVFAFTLVSFSVFVDPQILPSPLSHPQRTLIS